MKRITSTVIAVLLLNSWVNAQTKLYVSGTRLTKPLVEKWAEEFNKTQKNIVVSWAGKGIPSDSIQLSILAYTLSEKEVKPTQNSLVLTHYAQLPIVNSKRPDLADLQKKGFKQEDFKKIYFSPDAPLTATETSEGNKVPVVVYKRDRAVCATKSFAEQFKSNAFTSVGVGVSGDDKDLAKAVKKDVNGVSYNNLGFVYNTNTRKVADSLAVVPLDLNENGKVDEDEKIYDNLDNVISYIERTHHKSIPVSDVNVVFEKSFKSTAGAKFIDWILTEGQKYNHRFGFINQVPQSIETQKKVLHEL